MIDLSKSTRGFTMLEIIVVLLLICILGTAIFISGVYSTSEYDLSTETEIIKSHIRYAQTRAMNTDKIWGVEFFKNEDKSFYYLFRLDENSNKVNVSLPGEDSDPVALPEGMVVSPVVVYFDSWGKPYNVVPSQSAESITITVTIDTVAITITKNTGFIA
jgi:prepilin-type N-terminal cleavage/methylation domain-containing protein